MVRNPFSLRRNTDETKLNISCAYSTEITERQLEHAMRGCVVNTCVLGTAGCLYGILAIVR